MFTVNQKSNICFLLYIYFFFFFFIFKDKTYYRVFTIFGLASLKRERRRERRVFILWIYNVLYCFISTDLRAKKQAKSQEIVATWLLYSLQYPLPKSKSSTWDLAFLARFLCSLHGKYVVKTGSARACARIKVLDSSGHRYSDFIFFKTH